MQQVTLPIPDLKFNPLRTRSHLDPQLYSGLGSVPKQIADTILDYIENMSDSSILVMNSFAGSGKTYITSMVTSFLNDPYVYFTVNHQIASEFCSFKADNKWRTCLHMLGKNYKHKDTGEFECNDTVGHAILEKYGRNEFYCNEQDCPSWAGCQHRQNIEMLLNSDYPRSWAGHFLHYPSLYQIYEKRWGSQNKILKIFDEDMSNSFFVQSSFSESWMDEAIRNTEDLTTMTIFDCLKDSLKEFYNIPRERKDERLKCENDYKDEFLRLITTISRTDLTAERDQYNNKIKDYFGKKEELSHPNPYDCLIELKDFIENYRYGTPDGFFSIGFHRVNFDYFRLFQEDSNILILNATYEPKLFERLIPKNAVLVTKTITSEFAPNQKVYALKPRKDKPRYNTVPVTSLYDFKVMDYTDKFYLLAKRTMEFAKRHDKTVVFCVNRFYKELKDLYKEDLIDPLSDKGIISVDTFAWGVGKNDYKDYDGCVIFGTPYHNVEHFEKMVKLYAVDPAILMKNETENRIVQAVHRIRPWSFKDEKKDCEILIWSSLPFDDLKFASGNKMIRFDVHNFNKVFPKLEIEDNDKLVLDFIKEQVAVTITDLRNHFQGRHETIMNILNTLIKNGLISSEPQRGDGKGRPRTIYYMKE